MGSVDDGEGEPRLARLGHDGLEGVVDELAHLADGTRATHPRAERKEHALPIELAGQRIRDRFGCRRLAGADVAVEDRSEEHTSELQSHSDLVCRLLLEKKKTSSTS